EVGSAALCSSQFRVVEATNLDDYDLSSVRGVFAFAPIRARKSYGALRDLWLAHTAFAGPQTLSCLVGLQHVRIETNVVIEIGSSSRDIRDLVLRRRSVVDIGELASFQRLSRLSVELPVPGDVEALPRLPITTLVVHRCRGPQALKPALGVAT